MTHRKTTLTELELLKQKRSELIAGREKATVAIKEIDKRIAEIQAKVKNPVPKRRIIEFLKPILGQRGWTYEEMYREVFESDQIGHDNLEKRFKTSISCALRDKTLELREGRYYLRDR